MRRKVPVRATWREVAWKAGGGLPNRRDGTAGRLVVAGGLALGLAWGGFRFQMEIPEVDRGDPPAWIEIPPAQVAQRTSVGSIRERGQERSGNSPKATSVAPPQEQFSTESVESPAEPSSISGEPSSTDRSEGEPRSGDPAGGKSDALAGEGSGPIEVSGVPGSVRPVLPVYPPRAERMGLESRVVALVTTDSSGKVVDFRLEKSGGREFDHSVRQAVVATRFVVPRSPDGRARAVAFRLPYEFKLP